ncbi:MAG: rhomboid family intramembrane serine protease [Bacteroidetes bacterium]|nr:MAG: rhomboid family intramembrane serine protease [Bacteroidota bacterium]
MSWLDDIRYQFNKGNNVIRKLIIVNVFVFLLVHTVRLFGQLFLQDDSVGETFLSGLMLPALPSQFIYKPWTLFTYMFTQQGVMHIASNMIYLYFLGNIFRDFLGDKRLVQVYFWGGISGGLFFMLGMNLIPALIPYSDRPLLGASGSVLAVVAAIATLIPNYAVRLLIFNIPLKWIAVVMILLSYFGMGGGNPGGNLAHLGGALFGFLYTRYIRHYSILDTWGESITRLVNKVFKRKKDEKTMYRSYKTVYMKTDTEEKPNQDEIDAILDKINSSGYESLTRKEREALFKASK